MSQFENTLIHIDCCQSFVESLADFIELRFGVYLDTIMGFQYNLENFQLKQQKASQSIKLSMEDLDKQLLRRGNGPPSSNLEECQRREIHRMTQAAFKKNNSSEGVNYAFAIENCLSDIFNYWNAVKEKLGLKQVKDMKQVKDIDVFPVTAYMRDLRDRVQHDLMLYAFFCDAKQAYSFTSRTSTSSCISFSFYISQLDKEKQAEEERAK